MNPVVAAALLLAGSLTGAAAQSKLFIPNCNDIPCTLEVPGYVDRVGPAVVPWTAQLSFPKGLCLWVGRLVSDAGIHITIVAPDGLVYSREAGSRIPETAMDGWYTIQVTSVPPATEQLFTLEVTAYPVGFCSNQPPQ